MKAPDPTKAYFRRDGTVSTWWHPERPDDLHFEHFREQAGWVIAQVDWEGKDALDVGTGAGRLALACAQHGARVTGLDISREMLAEARSRASSAGAHVKFTLGDAELLPFPTARFDAVTCLEAVMHFPHPVTALREMARVVRPGGIILVSMTNRLRLLALVRWPDRALHRLRHGNRPGPPTFWVYSLREFRRLLAEAGLKPEETHGQGLLQAARIPIGRGRALTVIPQRLAHWFFTRVEPRLRETPVLAVMGTIMFVCRRADDRSPREGQLAETARA